MVTTPMISFGPWRPDQPDLNNPGVTIARNVTPAIGDGMISYQPIPSAQVYSDTELSGGFRGGGTGRNTSGEAVVYAGGTDKLYVVDNGSHEWVDISRPGGYATSENERWKFAEYGNIMTATNYSDYPNFVVKDLNVQFANLTTQFKARHSTVIRNHMVFGNTNDPIDGPMPNRMRWSADGDPGDYNPSLTTLSDFQDFANGGSIMGMVGGEAGYILMQTCIYKATYIGAPYVFQFNELPSSIGKGCIAAESVITLEGKTFYLAADGFYALEGDQVSSIGAGKVDRYFLTNADLSQFRFMSVATDPTKKLVYWAYCSRFGSYGVPDKIIIYNYQNGEWSEADCVVRAVMDSVALAWSIEDLDVYGTIEDVPAPFDSPIWAGGYPVLWGFDTNGAILTFAGTNMDGLLVTNEQQVGDTLRQMGMKTNSERAHVTRVAPLFHGNGGTAEVECGHRSRAFDNVVWTAKRSPDPLTGWAYTPIYEDRFHRFRFTFKNDWTQAMGFQIDANPAGSL